jgi:CARDB
MGLLSSNAANAQPLPDLIVTKIECVPPQSKLSFTVTNRSNVPLPKDWKGVARIYLPGRMEQIVDLRRPTSGSIEPAGGSATYLIAYKIKGKISVKVVADPTNSIMESNEGNNEKVQMLEPCPR